MIKEVLKNCTLCVAVSLSACGGGGDSAVTAIAASGGVFPRDQTYNGSTVAPASSAVPAVEPSTTPVFTSASVPPPEPKPAPAPQQALNVSAPLHLKYFGFYLVNTGIDDPTDGIAKTDYTDEVSFFTNLNQYSVYNPAQDIAKDIDSMAAACTRPFMAISAVFWRRVDGNATSGNRYALYPDWKERWGIFKSKNQTSLNSGRVGAIYMIDEPLWNGVPFSEVNAVSQIIKGDYPTIPILLIESYAMLADMVVPKTVDWIGFDRYSVVDPAKNPEYLRDLALLKSKRSNNQKIVIVGDTQWLPLYENELGVSARKMGSIFESYYNLAASDPDVIALLGYLWPGGFDGPRALGARNLPSEVQAVLVNQGKMIKANYSPCRDDR